MSEENKIKVSASPCLTEQEMTDYIRHRLSPEKRNRVEKHLLECDLCSDAMEGLSMMANTDALNSLDELISKRISAKPLAGKGKLVSMRINYRVAAALALLVIAGGVLYFILSDTGKNEKVLSQNIKPMDSIHAANRPIIEEKKDLNSSSSNADEKKIGTNNIDSDASLATRYKHITNTVKKPTEQKKMIQTTVTQEEKDLTLQTHAGEITGKVIDKQSKEAIPFATVTAELNGAVVSGAQTDINGVYSIKPLEPGKYKVKVSYMGYTPSEVAGVIVSPENNKEMDLAMNKGVNLGEVEAVGYKNPLIDKGNTTQTTPSQQQIVDAPVRDISSLAAQPVGAYNQDKNGALNVRGSRSDATQYYIDGKKQVSAKSARGKVSNGQTSSNVQKDSSFSIAMSAYNQKQYSAAVQLFGDYLKEYPDDEKATFYDAVSNLSIDSAATALTQLERVLDNGNSAFYDDANWYKALALVKLHQNKKAKRMLNKIKKTNSRHSDDAAKMLNEF